MKNNRFFWFLLIVLLSISDIKAEILTGNCGSNADFRFHEDGLLEIFGDGDMSDYQVKSQQPWSTIRNQITRVKISNGISSIGDYSFADCTNIISVDIPESIIRIGNYAFSGCSSITKILTSPTLITIGDFAFRNCTSLKEIVLIDGLRTIGSSSFSGCNSLENVQLPNSVTSIGKSAFENKSMYYIFEIGNDLEKVEEVFGTSSRIDTLVIGNGIKTISDYLSVFGSDQCTPVSNPNIFLITNNIVNLSSLSYRKVQQYTYHIPKCSIFVADSTRYDESLVKTYGIKNIISSSSCTTEYTGLAPNINIKSRLIGYLVNLDASCYNVGSYNNMKVSITKNDFSSVITVPCNYTIKKAPLTITPKDIILTYGDEIPNTDCIYQGLKNNETPDYALSKLPSVTTSATQDSDAGEYKLYASGAEAKNYSISYQTGKLTIKPAEQSIEWKQNFDNVVTDSKIELSATSSSGLEVQYSSSDPAIAYIAEERNKTYLYTRKDGVVVITASQAGNKNYKTASSLSKTIIVTPRTATGISLSETNISLRVGEEFCLTATVSPESTINKNIEWKSLDDAIATVSNGVVRALKIGETTIQATTRDGSNLTASCQVVVSPVMISSIALSPNSANIDVGENILLSAEIAPTDASNRHLQWSSSNTEIATVLDGVVTGIKPGQATITAQSTDGSNKTATATITVKDIKASDISIDKTSVNLFVGNEEELHATISPKDASNKEVFWGTSDATVATVTDGVVIATGSGTAIIKASTTDGTNLSATCQVIVNKKKQTVSWQQSLDNIQHGGQLVELTATSSSGLRIKYKSSDDRVVSIFDLGEIVYLNPGNPGQTTVIAYQEGNNEYLSIEAAKDVSVINTKKEEGNVLIVYYSQSVVIDGIVAELANQIVSSGVSAVTKKIEPTNARINDANIDESVRDSIMNEIIHYPNMPDSYPSIAPIDVNVSEYDNILMVYPIWNNKMAAPMQTFCLINKTVLKNKSIAYIEYDLLGDSGTSANAKVLRLNASDLDDKEDIIKEWLNHSSASGIIKLRKDKDNTTEDNYDLQGRKVTPDREHGLYIIKGRKIIR